MGGQPVKLNQSVVYTLSQNGHAHPHFVCKKVFQVTIVLGLVLDHRTGQLHGLDLFHGIAGFDENISGIRTK